MAGAFVYGNKYNEQEQPTAHQTIDVRGQKMKIYKSTKPDVDLPNLDILTLLFGK